MKQKQNTERRVWTKSELEQANVYSQACQLKGIDLAALQDEMLDPPESLSLSLKEARKLGLIE